MLAALALAAFPSTASAELESCARNEAGHLVIPISGASGSCHRHVQSSDPADWEETFWWVTPRAWDLRVTVETGGLTLTVERHANGTLLESVTGTGTLVLDAELPSVLSLRDTPPSEVITVRGSRPAIGERTIGYNVTAWRMPPPDVDCGGADSELGSPAILTPGAPCSGVFVENTARLHHSRDSVSFSLPPHDVATVTFTLAGHTYAVRDESDINTSVVTPPPGGTSTHVMEYTGISTPTTKKIQLSPAWSHTIYGQRYWVPYECNGEGLCWGGYWERPILDQYDVASTGPFVWTASLDILPNDAPRVSVSDVPTIIPHGEPLAFDVTFTDADGDDVSPTVRLVELPCCDVVELETGGPVAANTTRHYSHVLQQGDRLETYRIEVDAVDPHGARLHGTDPAWSQVVRYEPSDCVPGAGDAPAGGLALEASCRAWVDSRHDTEDLYFIDVPAGAHDVEVLTWAPQSARFTAEAPDGSTQTHDGSGRFTARVEGPGRFLVRAEALAHDVAYSIEPGNATGVPMPILALSERVESGLRPYLVSNGPVAGKLAAYTTQPLGKTFNIAPPVSGAMATALHIHAYVSACDQGSLDLHVNGAPAARYDDICAFSPNHSDRMWWSLPFSRAVSGEVAVDLSRSASLASIFTTSAPGGAPTRGVNGASLPWALELGLREDPWTAGRPVQLLGMLDDPIGDTASVKMHWGDGTTESFYAFTDAPTSILHVYDTPGTYDVVANVVDVLTKRQSNSTLRIHVADPGDCGTGRDLSGVVPRVSSCVGYVGPTDASDEFIIDTPPWTAVAVRVDSPLQDVTVTDVSSGRRAVRVGDTFFHHAGTLGVRVEVRAPPGTATYARYDVTFTSEPAPIPDGRVHLDARDFGLRGQTLALDARALDVHHAPIRFETHWGDGVVTSWPTNGTYERVLGDVTPLHHAYAQTGTYALRVAATSADGRDLEPQAHTIRVIEADDCGYGEAYDSHALVFPDPPVPLGEPCFGSILPGDERDVYETNLDPLRAWRILVRPGIGLELDAHAHVLAPLMVRDGTTLFTKVHHPDGSVEIRSNGALGAQTRLGFEVAPVAGAGAYEVLVEHV